MKFLVVLPALLALCYGSSLEIVSSPANLKLPETATDLKTTQISSLNEYILGLSAKPVEGFNVEVDIFSRPRALAVINVEGIERLNVGKSYAVEENGIETVGIEQELAIVFGQDRQSVQLSAGGITGSQLALRAQQQNVDTGAIKTKHSQLRKELEAVYQLAAAIKAEGPRIGNTADVFRVTISELAGLSDEAERAIAIEDIKNAINSLNTAIANAYGGQAIVEVIVVEGAIKKVDDSSIPAHHITKRDANTEAKNIFEVMRIRYQITYPVAPDYPAIFAIFVGLVVVLVLALIYIVVGMMSMDPGKDSIIYRMTTTRMKKD
ncbi:unnamed protein product [Caenorhabditis bovis]|uniref:Renin receptor-like C-terminal transmembrane spanning segment domain-containing protein n=1 Tax=Caenorhabditis bovis TaxID=2654633 RepID=A0A8S1EN76_9PELO|nr:unnamed protein product [Caenorhabditis bovis]